MNFFGNTKNESTTKPGDITDKYGSGAEQDRYGGHFSMGSNATEHIKQAATEFKGMGAEQDRYQSHFGLDADKVKAAAMSIMNAKGSGAEQDRHASHFGLGADGWARAQELARTQGIGAEQVHFVHPMIQLA